LGRIVQCRGVQYIPLADIACKLLDMRLQAPHRRLFVTIHDRPSRRLIGIFIDLARACY
jgi:hypothetical protein